MDATVEFANWVLPLLAALFGGVGATLVVEVIIKPRRERRSVGRTIAGETSYNLQLIALYLAAQERHPRSIPADFRLSTIAFQALASQIGGLPSDVRNLVILMYNQVEYLNRTAELYSQILERFRTTSDENPYHAAYKGEVDATLEAFYRILNKAFDTANRTTELLHKRVESRFFGEKREMGSFESIRERAHKGLDERDQRLGRKKPEIQ